MQEAEILYDALRSEFGVRVKVLGNYQISLQRLYAARKKDPDLDVLQIYRSPHDVTELWIVKTDRPAPVETIKESPQGKGPLFSLADILGDD